MLKLFRRLKRKEEGFTLIELVVVVVIIGVLTAALVPSVLGRVNDAKLARYKADADAIATAARMYFVDNGAWPTLAELKDYGITTTQDPWEGDYVLTGSGNTSGEFTIAASEGAPDDVKDVTIPAP